MPMLDLTYPKGAIAPDAREELLEELATKMLAAEKAPDTEFFRSITWVYANEIEPELARGRRPPRRRAALPRPGHRPRRRALGPAQGHPRRLGQPGRPAAPPGSTRARASASGRVIREVPDGNWGAAGQQVRYKQLVEAAAAEREKAGAPA